MGCQISLTVQMTRRTQMSNLKETEFALQNKIKHSPSKNTSITSITKGVELMSISSFMESEYAKPEIIVKHFIKSRSSV